VPFEGVKAPMMLNLDRVAFDLAQLVRISGWLSPANAV
jgi:hypothetical protein